MDVHMQDHIFEPFFTTKDSGKRTGLGLSTVLGIVEQSGGHIRCQSEVGLGTSFKIFLPAVGEPAQPRPRVHAGLLTAPKGTEGILLVEDDDTVRALVGRILRVCGYAILESRSGRDALKLCETHQGKIDLLLTDVVMPLLGGRELAE